MQARLTPSTLLLLTLAPLLWAGNAVVGRMLAGQIPPMTLNFLRWLLALLLLLPWTAGLLRPGSPLWKQWRHFLVLGLLGVGCYNALQYLALETSTALNVTLVAASAPVWMLAVGAVAFGQRITGRQVAGACLSIAGVLVVLSGGSWEQLLQVKLVPGDFYVLLATLSWAWYSWLLVRPVDPPALRSDWAAFLTAQMVYGLFWAGLFAAGEWAVEPQAIHWSWGVAAALAYVALGPALLAYRSWGLAVQRVGPNLAGIFANLAPLFAALLSAAFLGEPPQAFHGGAFVLIVGGIAVASARR